MRIGIIDLGTNSVRFDVQWIGPRNQTQLLHREKIMVRLGQGVFIHQKLDTGAKRRTIEAFLSFGRTASHFHTSKTVAFGTSALREATDANAFINLIRQKTGIDIRVISGEEEAQLIALGILNNEKKIKGRFGLVDIGGGSTEISICHEKTVLHSASFPLGTARLQQVFLKKATPTPQRIDALRSHIRNVISTRQDSESWPRVPKMFGSSGTVRALERLLKRATGKDGIARRDLKDLVREMKSMSRPELLAIDGMEPKRVDMILAGAILLEECLDSFGADELITTNYSLRDGILDREIQLHSAQRGPESYFQLEELYRKATRFGFSKKSLQIVVHTAEDLFERTRNIHLLKSSWKRYLSAGAILREIGSVISPTHYEAHSYYIVKNADFLAMERWEAEFIAQLCLKYNFSSISKKDLAFSKDKGKRLAFSKILSLLKLADGLAFNSKSPIKIQRTGTTKTEIKLTLKSRNPSDLKILRINQKKQLFEEVFKRKLTIVGSAT